MLRRMNLPRKSRAATTLPSAPLSPTSPTTTTPSRCPPLPLEIWTQIVRALILHAVEDLPELWADIRLLSHTLKAALETAFADEHLSCMWLYVSNPNLPIPEGLHPWRRGNWTRSNAPTPLKLMLSHFSPDRRRAYFVLGGGMRSWRYRRDGDGDGGERELREAIARGLPECTDNTVVAEWLRSARGIPPPGVRPTEGRLKMTVGPDCAWTHWKHPVIGSDGFVVESRGVTFKDDGTSQGDSEEDEKKVKRNRNMVHALGLEVDRTKCEVSLEWTTLISCVFARPRKTFGEAFRK
ncbi:uncharacterized protein F4822DRAFT_131778 [Hypoxylon trugodes]|uniref:uncharacterized protein n=1 Tax=Hypoxylon trugodes TaxID=326681 RepID=UPI002190BB59|nr:uncharacterized protein F4822DRAFT_131778 [Hypoxylon trugodes]KAI1392529.1 hypothetical protein F4822DRAFT_131778 [Hypoxylon trugodes]